jgi:hypothetical protein
MPLPVEFNTVTIHGQYRRLDGTIPSGTVTFTGPVYLQATGSNVLITPSSFAVSLDGTGSFTQVLPATNDPDINPVGWAYTVTETIAGATRTYPIEIPYNAITTLELADIIGTKVVGVTITDGGTFGVAYTVSSDGGTF